MTAKKPEGVEKDPLDDIFDPENVPASNWFKFDNVGDKVAGVLVGYEAERVSRDETMPNQRVFELKQKDGTIVKVGIAITKDYIIGRTNGVKLGDIVAFEFKKEIPPSKKGFAPAKSIEVYIKKGVAPVADEDHDNY